MKIPMMTDELRTPTGMSAVPCRNDRDIAQEQREAMLAECRELESKETPRISLVSASRVYDPNDVYTHSGTFWMECRS